MGDLHSGENPRWLLWPVNPAEHCRDNQNHGKRDRPKVAIRLCGYRWNHCDRTGSTVPLQPLQVRPHLRRALVSEITILLKRFVDDALQVRWNVGIQPHYDGWPAVQNGIED